MWYEIIEWPLFGAPSSRPTHGVFTSLVYLSAVAYIFVEISLGSCWCWGYLKGQRSRIYHKLQLFMTLCEMQSSSGNYSIRHQVPMVFLLLLIYLSAVTCISEERNLGQCWRKDILRMAQSNELIEWPLSDAPTSIHVFFFFFLLHLLYLITDACIREISLGSCWHKMNVWVKGQP